MIKVGVIVAGHLGKIHLNILNNSDFELVGFHDTDVFNSEKLSQEKGYSFFKELHLLIEKIDAAVIVSPTTTHFEIAKECINKGKHIFVEKPLTKDSNEARIIETMAKEKGIIGQVGFVERYNEAFISCREFINNPKFIESHRLSDFNPRGTDVSVIMDLMIHDIDILLSLVEVPIKKIQATGLSILTNSIDIAHARIRFEDGTVASVMSSRIAKDEVRKVKIFQKDLYATLDLLIGSTEIYEVVNDKTSKYKMTIPFDYKGNTKLIGYHKPDLSKGDPLRMELENFILSIQGKQLPIVSGKDGRDALEVAIKIQEMIILDKH